MTDLIDDEQNGHSDQQQWNTFQRMLGRPWWGYAVTLLGTYFLIVGVPAIFIVLGGGTTGNSSSGMSTAYVLAGLIFVVMVFCIGCAIFRDLVRKAGGLFPEPEQNPWRRRGWIMCGIGFGLFMLASFIELSRPISAAVDMQDWGKHRFGQNQFEISIPPGWSFQPVPRGQLEGFSCFAPGEDSTVLLVCLGSRNPDGNIPTPDGLLAEIQENKRSLFRSSAMIASDVHNTSGAVVVDCLFDVINGNDPTRILVRGIVSHSSVAQIEAWMPEGARIEEYPEIIQIIDTVTEVSDP